jgi:hypothetical protein
MSAILAAIRAVDEPAALLPTVLAHVYDALLRADGRRLADLKNDGGRISPDDWQIQATQWDAIAQAASDRADWWGSARNCRPIYSTGCPAASTIRPRRPAPNGHPQCQRGGDVRRPRRPRRTLDLATAVPMLPVGRHANRSPGLGRI